VPLEKMPQTTSIKEMSIRNDQAWKNVILSQLQPYKKYAPYYNEVRSLIAEVLEPDYSDITSLNKATLEAVCRYLGFEVELDVFSRMDLQIAPANNADEWALRICQALGDITEYWNPPGGQAFFDKTKYDESGISLRFHSQHLRAYNQKRSLFESGLSIIDVMMFNSVPTINTMLDEYELI
jgi:hypothetical protein